MRQILDPQEFKFDISCYDCQTEALTTVVTTTDEIAREKAWDNFQKKGWVIQKVEFKGSHDRPYTERFYFCNDCKSND